MTSPQEQIDQISSALTTHIENYDELKVEFIRKEVSMLAAQEKNTENIRDLTIATKGLVDAWTAANAFHKLLKWLSSFAVLGAAIT